ncbi:Potassium voltage-gated channel sub H member 5 [Perkinsus olseni]|uniref:Potassium voltage-gated channel sub H member 5 n=1 Tax=Perkinsus olseni TaxID=32597 RepID=A0A7J6RPE8_PEROL|nr:Potassium voltage-gated channel sub H member 5 [Perkinsus olseni]
MSAAVHKRRPSLLQSSSFLIPPIRRQNSKGANFSSPEITDREDLIKTLRAISSDIAKAVLLDVQESIDQLSRSLNDKIDTVLAELGSERATTASPASSSDRRVSAAADRKHSRILFDRPGSTNDLSGSDHDVASPTNQARIVFGRRNRNIPITEKTASIPNLPGAPQTETSPLPSRRVARGASREHPPRASGSHRTSSSSSRSSSPSERARRQESRRARASITNFNAEEPRRRGSLDRTQSGGNRGRRNSHDAIEQNEEEVPSPRDCSGRESVSLGTTRVEAQSAEVGETNVGSESPVAELTHGHLKELLERYTAAEIEEKSVARARASTAGANKTSERTSVTKRTGRRAAVNLLALSSKLNLQGLITEEGSERMMTVTEQLTMIATSTATAVRDFFKEPVSPSSSGRIVWDMILAAALVYVIIGIPFEAAFVASEGSYPSSQLVLDAILLIDVLLQFHTQFSENGALISSRKRIARRYLKSWLWPELLTSIPWGLFISKYSRELSAIKLGRTLSLARLGNMTMTIMAKVEYRVQSEIWWIILGVLKLVSALLVMCHWGACLWWLVGKLSIEDHDISWITAMDMVDATRAQQYVAAMYFMTTTLTTVGYGDVTPETHVERLFCIFAEIVAGNVFALFSGLLCALMLTYDESGSQYRAKLKDAMRYMNKHKLESSLRIRVRHFLHQLFENQTNLESRRALVEFLRTSESLQRDVYVGLMGKMLKRYSWFKGLSHEILGKVCSVCEDLYYAPTDVMIYASEDADGMYFVVRGSIELGW